MKTKMAKTYRAIPWNLTVAALLLLPGSGVSAPPAEVAAPVADEPYRVGEGVTRPEKVSGTPPVYTEDARKARVTGVVILEAIIDEQGNVTNVKVLKGLPMGLNQAAMEAVQSWKFKPATFEGQPVRVYYTLTVNFQISDNLALSPVFRRFLENNPDFAGLLQDRRYQEAAELLDRWIAERPADSEISLARSYLLLRQGRLDEAWEEARSYRGPEPFEIFYSVGIFAYYDKALDPGRRAEVIELGLQAMTLAVAARSDFPGALLYKNLLLREKAKLTLDPDARKALIDEAKQFEKLALEIQARARGAKLTTKSGPETGGLEGTTGVEPLRAGGNVTRPEKLSGDLPAYTELGRKARVDGNVIIEIVVDEQGDVVETRVVKGLPMGLDKAALDAIEGWKFKPATRDGVPVKVRCTFNFRFTPPSHVEAHME